MLWRLPLRLFWWLFGGLIRTAVTLLLLFGIVYLVLRLTPLDEFWRARFYAHLGNFTEAERWYRLGLQQYPRSRFAPQGHYELAELLFRQERYKEAIGHYGKALESGLTPEQKREALLKIAEAFQKIGEPLEAARRFEEFAKNFPRRRAGGEGVVCGGRKLPASRARQRGFALLGEGERQLSDFALCPQSLMGDGGNGGRKRRCRPSDAPLPQTRGTLSPIGGSGESQRPSCPLALSARRLHGGVKSLRRSPESRPASSTRRP
jgi:Uncharacterized protein conserved in bacteria